MNRTILIVICDFLLVSLLAFSTVDVNKLADSASQRTSMRMDMAQVTATNTPGDGASDLAATMRMALEEERRNREQLLNELARTRETVGQQQNVLSEQERQVRAFRQELETKEQQAARLQREQEGLMRQFALAQTNIQGLSQKLQDTSQQAEVSKERLAAMEAELRKQNEQASALQQRISTLQQSNQVVLNERMRLSTQLQVVEVEKRFAAEQVARMQEQVKVEREEKARLVEGVKTLATNSIELTKEIRENRPLAPNAIFFDVLTNRVQARFHAQRSGAFGLDSNRRRETETVLVTNGTNTFAICHVDDTPLVLWNPGTDWESLVGSLTSPATQLPIRSMSFFRRDPRLVLIPVSPAEVKRLGSKAYEISSDPFKFQDAVLVGTREGYYGECRFQIDISTPDYVKLDNSFIKGLFGKFNPSRGDLVFSKNGELLGIMANNNYCLMLRNFQIAATFQLQQDMRLQNTGRTLAQLYGIVQGLPSRLQ
jgi:hypothetical protein